MNQIEEYYKIIEEAISRLGVNPETCRDDKEKGAWAVMREEQEIWIDCWYNEEEKLPFFQVLAPILQVDDALPLSFFRDVLEINYTMIGAGFGIYNNLLSMKSVRDATGMDANEALSIIARVGDYSIGYGAGLKSKYFEEEATDN